MEQDPNAITPSTPEQVQVMQQPEVPVQPTEPVAPAPTADVAPAAQTQGESATGYDAYTDDAFKSAYTELCTRMGREFGIRHDLVTENGVTDVTKFKNVLVVAKKE